MGAITKEKVAEAVAAYQAEHNGAFPPVRAVYKVLGGDYKRLSEMLSTLRPADDVDDIPVIPQAMIDVCATVLRFDSLAARTRALVEERLPALEGQHAELMAAVNSLRERHQALAKDVAVLEGRRGALLLELAALQGEVKRVLADVRPVSNWEVASGIEPKF